MTIYFARLIGHERKLIGMIPI